MDSIRKRGRPAFKDIETKSEIMHFRVTPAERRKIMAACEYNGQSVRELLLGLLNEECNRSTTFKYILKSAESDVDNYYEDYDDYEDEEYYDE